MPELNCLYDATNSSSTMTLIPSHGDTRIVNSDLEIFEYSSWIKKGHFDVSSITSQLLNSTSDLGMLKDFYYAEVKRRKQVELDTSLESQFPILSEAGDHLRNLREAVATVEQSYKLMSIECKAQLETFTTLDQSEELAEKL